MRPAFLFLFLILLVQCTSSPDKPAEVAATPRHSYDYCYTNKTGIFVFNAGDRTGRHIKWEANDVQLSPDGTWLAYTDVSDSQSDRRIGLMDLESGKTTILDSACHNCYGPVWSPDGQYLAYNAFSGGEWNIKYVDTGDKHADFLTKVKGHEHDCFSPQWTADSKRVLVQDLSAIYFIDLKGNVVKTIAFGDIDSTISGSSSMRFLLTPREDKLIYESELSTDSAAAPGSEEPPTYIFSYDMPSKKITRLTNWEYNCYNPVLKGDTIFCHGWDPHCAPGDMGNVYSLTINGGDFKLAFKNCRYFSCRTKP
ncbi:MAG TPA: hypothetical protein VGM31_12045 [Puia sp.]